MELQAFLPTEKLDGIGFCHLEKVVIIVFIVVISIEKKKEQAFCQKEKKVEHQSDRQEQPAIAQGDADVVGSKVDRGQRWGKTVPHQSSTPEKVSSVSYAIFSVSKGIQKTCLAKGKGLDVQVNIYRSRLGRIVTSQSWKEVRKSKDIYRELKKTWHPAHVVFGHKRPDVWGCTSLRTRFLEAWRNLKVGGDVQGLYCHSHHC